ncbi:MAG TPA: MBL fold metallo-hydrolase [Rickettsiales bacterium]|nr:MBL fold metallo-hydrolase [Rickettsiales bacterium]
MRIEILGSGTADGYPRITNNFLNIIDNNNTKNIRLRSSFYLQDNDDNLLVECGPDIRQQTIKYNIKDFDNIFISHGHTDHMIGIWELEEVVSLYKRNLKIHGNEQTTNIIKERFPWMFDNTETENGSIILKTIKPLEKIKIGSFEILPMNFKHGNHFTSMGFRYKNFAFSPDLNEIPQENDEHLQNLDLWLLECNDLEYDPKYGHTYLQQAINFIEKYKPKNAILTHIGVEIDYDKISKILPYNVKLAYDGMEIEI